VWLYAHGEEYPNLDAIPRFELEELHDLWEVSHSMLECLEVSGD